MRYDEVKVWRRIVDEIFIGSKKKKLYGDPRCD